jgi:glucose/arabinose dehydrogenase
MGWAPGTDLLWTSVNERDGLGDDLVPDYTMSVQENGFYGWPFAYYGKNPDPRSNGARMDLVEQSITPDIALGSHTSSIGLVFNSKNYFTKPYFGGMFIGQHGSWNRKELNGYKVIFIPFKNGKPSGPPQDFLTGFIANKANNTAYGRPVGLEFTKDGALLIADDSGNRIWRVSNE